MQPIREVVAKLLRYWPAKVTSLGVAVLLVLFNDFSSLDLRVISVPLEIVHSEEFLPATDLPSNVRVSLRGEGEEIVGILSEDLRAHIDLSHNEQSGLRTSSIIVERRGNALNVDPLEIGVEPSQISLRMENRQIGSPDVQPVVTGALPAGYRVLQVRVSPSVVEVAGPQSVMEQLEALNTETIDIAGRRESFVARVGLVSPRPFLQYLSGGTVEVTVEIGETQITNTYTGVDVEVVNVAPNLSVVPPLPKVDLVLEGRYSLLQGLDTDLVVFTADASEITAPGEYQMPVQYEVPEELADITLFDVSPDNVNVIIE